jgi:hypothetical protein
MASESRGSSALLGLACDAPTLSRARSNIESEITTHRLSLPLAAVEPPHISLSWNDSAIGRVDAAPGLSACDLVISSCTKRAHPGHSASFVLGLSTSEERRTATATELSALAAIARVEAIVRPIDAAVLESAASPPASVDLLPVTYEPAADMRGVIVSIPVPCNVPEGSCIVIRRVSVVGTDVLLGDAPLRIMVGYNHAVSKEGPVMFDACMDHAPDLMRALDDGASTEEADSVRPCIWGLRNLAMLWPSLALLFCAQPCQPPPYTSPLRSIACA